MAVIGCDIPVRQVVGADKLGSAKAGIWTKTHFWQEGDYLHAKTFLVAAGEPSVLEFRVDLRPLEKVAARVHQRMHEQMAKASGGPVVGFSFAKAFKSIKNTAKKIGHSKLVKAVGGAIKTVAKSKLVGALATGLAVAVPVIGVPALAAYGTANAALKAVDKGKKIASVASKAKASISKASSQGQKLDAAKAQAAARAKAAADAATARAKAQAAQIAAKAKATAAKVPAAAVQVKAQAAAQAKATLAAGKQAATNAAKGVVAQVQAAEKKVAPVVAAATTLQAKLADPAVRTKLLAIKGQADSAKKLLSDIKEKAQHGTGAEKLEAQKNAAIVNLVAKNQARIQQMSQQNAGGLPSLLIDSRGRIVRGKFKVLAKAGGKNPDVLYQGPKAKTQSGAFSKVAGVPGIGANHGHWWTIAIRNPKSNRWVSLQSNGILFRDHASASKAAQHHARRGVDAKAAIVKHTPSPEELAKSQKLLGTKVSGVPGIGCQDIPGETVGASPFPPLSPREKQAKQAEYAAWLSKHAPRRGHHRVGWAQSPAWATTVAGDDDPEVGCHDAEVSGHLKPLPQTGEIMPPGARVRFFQDRKSYSGKVLKAGGGNYLMKYRPRPGSKYQVVNVPAVNVYAVDARSVRMRRPTNDRFSRVGWAQSPAWATTVGWSAPPAWTTPPGSIGCDCEGSKF